MSAKIVFLNGPPECGKDTLADHCVETYKGIRKTKFATPLKAACHTLMGLPFGNEDHADQFEEIKDEPNPLFFNMTPREMYIKMSEEFLKPIAGKTAFGYIWWRRNKDYMDARNLIIVSDCGFVEELQPIMMHHPDEDMALIRIHRADCDFRRDSRSYISNVMLHEADLNNIEGIPQNMYSDFVKILARWGWSDALKPR